MARMTKRVKKVRKIKSNRKSKRQRSECSTSNLSELYVIKVHSFINRTGSGMYKAAMIRVMGDYVRSSVISSSCETNNLVELEIIGLAELFPEVPQGIPIYVETINQDVINLFTGKDGLSLDVRTKELGIEILELMSKDRECWIGLISTNDPFMTDVPIALDDLNFYRDLDKSIAVYSPELIF